ncbi:hypothetical protein HYFRA_00011905 [Hymenoscyphus fraxineus]|uniref:Uncharacterized protein n=1 Tax=Hymenoscyphus fraxineus TaxID=746836 RepID=A0A9N9KZ91_9HELO|nr:hypothetical protein HYFRA_00011905 [Hymenoscyphus fraxineus]
MAWHGVSTVQRGNCPHLVESTALLAAAVLNDERGGNSSYCVRAAYGGAFCRYQGADRVFWFEATIPATWYLGDCFGELKYIVGSLSGLPSANNSVGCPGSVLSKGYIADFHQLRIYSIFLVLLDSITGLPCFRAHGLQLESYFDVTRDMDCNSQIEFRRIRPCFK